MREIPVGLQKVLAGFFDGDGSLYMNRGALYADVAQSSYNDDPPPSLLLFQSCLGGHVQGPYRHEENQKPQWKWSTSGNNCPVILNIIQTHGVLKAPQASIGLEALAARKPEGKSGLRKPLSTADAAKYSKLLIAAKEEYATVDIDDTKLTPEYIAGFFCAEACVFYSTTSQISLYLAQSGCVRILERINAKLGHVGGVYSSKQLSIQKNEHCVNLLSLLEPFLIEKHSQAELVLKHSEVTQARGKGKKRTPKEIAADLEIELKCKALKKYHAEEAAVAK
jgi:hypothetical protein